MKHLGVFLVGLLHKKIIPPVVCLDPADFDMLGTKIRLLTSEQK